MDKPEALRLAAALTQPTYPDWVMHIPALWHPPAQAVREAAAELRRLSAVEAHRDALLEALKGITPSMPPADAPCHYGIVPQEKCGHCGRIAKARAAIKSVEGENHAKSI